jgi:hypothetical protein
MKTKFNNCVALQVKEPASAQAFYEKHFGMKFEIEENGSKCTKHGEILFFIDKSAIQEGPVIDLLVHNPEEAKKLLVEAGCKVIKWDHTGKYLLDPYGLCFNLSEGTF